MRARFLFVTILCIAWLWSGFGEVELGLASPLVAGQTVVSADSLTGKLMMGYQGWFGAKGDGSTLNRWMHWSLGWSETPNASNTIFEMWPDTSELDADELFATGYTMSNGSAAPVFSVYKEKTVLRHVKWMADNYIDGVFLQRFICDLSIPARKAFRDKVTRNIRKGSEQYGRVFAIMYDIAGSNEATLVNDIINDWKYLVDTMGVTTSSRYVRHKGKPVVAIAGIGWTDRPGTAEQAHQILDFFKNGPTQYRATVMGSISTFWRVGAADLRPNFGPVFDRLDIISTWNVGVYATIADVDAQMTRIIGDLNYTRARDRRIDYMPVLFPGFSWSNLHPGTTFNQIRRLAGRFFWKQAYEFEKIGVNMLYGAMFDEIDEGTAMFKVAANSKMEPTQGRFVTLNEDGTFVPSDWYLRIAGEATRMLRLEIPRTPSIPFTPPAVVKITHGYRGILGREPDFLGLETWATALSKGSVTVLGYCQSAFASTEFAQNRSMLTPEELATELYEGILEREPDASGFAAAVSAIRNGQGANWAAAMLNSVEFATKFLQ